MPVASGICRCSGTLRQRRSESAASGASVLSTGASQIKGELLPSGVTEASALDVGQPHGNVQEGWLAVRVLCQLAKHLLLQQSSLAQHLHGFDADFTAVVAGCLCIGRVCQAHMHVSMRHDGMVGRGFQYNQQPDLTRELLLIVHPLSLSLILTLLSASWKSMSSKRPEPCLATKTWMSCCRRPVRLDGEVLRLRSSAWRTMYRFLVPPCWEKVSLTCWPYNEAVPSRGAHHWEPTLPSTRCPDFLSYRTCITLPRNDQDMGRPARWSQAAIVANGSSTSGVAIVSASLVKYVARAVFQGEKVATSGTHPLQLSRLLVALELHIVVKPSNQLAVEMWSGLIHVNLWLVAGRGPTTGTRSLERFTAPGRRTCLVNRLPCPTRHSAALPGQSERRCEASLLLKLLAKNRS